MTREEMMKGLQSIIDASNSTAEMRMAAAERLEALTTGNRNPQKRERSGRDFEGDKGFHAKKILAASAILAPIHFISNWIATGRPKVTFDDILVDFPVSIILSLVFYSISFSTQLKVGLPDLRRKAHRKSILISSALILIIAWLTYYSQK